MGFSSTQSVIALGNVTDGTHTAIVSHTRGGLMAATGATGTYALTLDRAWTGNNCTILTSLLNNSGIINTTNTSDTVKTFTTFAVDGVTAADKNFSWCIFNIFH